IPAYLRRQVYAIPQRKRPRRRGKRGGEAVRIRAYLLSLRGKAPGLNSSGCYAAPMTRQRWLLRVFPDGCSQGAISGCHPLPAAGPDETRQRKRGRRSGRLHTFLQLNSTDSP
ncbi:hypothetical protein KUCAC02_031919, partial [Chaenocephalus aceratus]